MKTKTKERGLFVLGVTIDTLVTLIALAVIWFMGLM